MSLVKWGHAVKGVNPVRRESRVSTATRGQWDHLALKENKGPRATSQECKARKVIKVIPAPEAPKGIKETRQLEVK